MSNDDRATTFTRDAEAGAAYAKALLTGQPVPGGSVPRPAADDASAAEGTGADEARALIAMAGQPTSHRAGTAGAVGADAAAGASEARRLLGKE